LTQVYAEVVAICSDQPVRDRCVVFDFVARWKECFVSMINRTFTLLLMMGVFSRVCSGVLWGMRESTVSDFGRGHWFFCWVGGIGNGKRRHRGPWSLSYVHSMSYVFMLCIVSYIYISSLCSGDFVDATACMFWFGVWWGNDTDVPRTGCARMDSATRRVSFYFW
jgi:hypothetical protein